MSDLFEEALKTVSKESKVTVIVYMSIIDYLAENGYKITKNSHSKAMKKAKEVTKEIMEVFSENN